jgi:hypothetical protein
VQDVDSVYTRKKECKVVEMMYISASDGDCEGMTARRRNDSVAA